MIITEAYHSIIRSPVDASRLLIKRVVATSGEQVKYIASYFHVCTCMYVCIYAVYVYTVEPPINDTPNNINNLRTKDSCNVPNGDFPIVLIHF